MNFKNNIEQKENSPVNLKEAEVSDISKLIEIEKSVAGKMYAAVVNEDDWEKRLKKNKVYLIKKGNEAAGDLCYRKKYQDQDIIYISGLAIAPSFQGKGIAREALVKLMQELKDVERVELVTHPENLRAIELYKSLGFVVESRSENHYGDGEPRLILARVLDRGTPLKAFNGSDSL